MDFVSINKFTLLDYPEKVACVLYTQACNFMCPYCHNWETLIKGKIPQLPFEEILSFLEKNTFTACSHISDIVHEQICEI